jgi:hypothetical protein
MAMAQVTDKSDQLWQNFYAKLSAIIRGPNKDAQMMVCLQVPGLPLKPLDSTKPVDRDYVNELLDKTAAYNPVYTPGKIGFSKVYGDILQFHKSDPAIPLSPSEQAELQKALELTAPKGPVIKKYNGYRDDFDDAVTAREAERWDNLAAGKGFTNKRSSDSAVNDAMDNWQGDGQKNIVDAARSTIVKYSNNDPGSWWTGLSNNFRNAMQGSFYNVSTFPPMEQWASDDGWLKFTYKASDTKSSQQFNSMDVKASASLHIGKFSGTASGGYASTNMNALASDDSLVITMEFKKVIVGRPWMDWQVFTNNKWSWPNPTVSDGKGGGTLPLYTDAFIIVRNVKFSAKSISTFKTKAMQEINASVDASYGPFSMTSTFNKHDESQSEGAKEDKGAIQIPDPQIIAYCCSVVPKCPAKTVR